MEKEKERFDHLQNKNEKRNEDDNNFDGERPQRSSDGERRDGGRSFGGGERRDGGRSFGGGERRDGGRSFGGGERRDGGRSFGGGERRDGGRSFGGGERRDGGRSFGGGERRDGGRSFGGGERSDGGRSFGGGERRDSGRSFGGGERRDGGRSFGGGERRDGGRSFDNDRPRRSFDGDRKDSGRSFDGDRPRRSFDGDNKDFADKKRATLFNNRNKDFRKETATKSRNFVYGCNPAFEVIRGGKRQIESALISSGSLKSARIQKLIEIMDEKEIKWEQAEKGRLIDICENHDHQGVVLFCSQFPVSKFQNVFAKNNKIVLLNNLEDPQNVGAILRSAEVFGFTGALLPEKGLQDIYPSVVKASAGATEFLDICLENTVTTYLEEAKENGFTIVALDGKGEKTFADVKADNSEKILLIIGGEDKGVGQFVLGEADFICSIPQTGKVNSLNASVAAGIAMSALM